jgi:hypothetical protein
MCVEARVKLRKQDPLRKFLNPISVKENKNSKKEERDEQMNTCTQDSLKHQSVFHSSRSLGNSFTELKTVHSNSFLQTARREDECSFINSIAASRICLENSNDSDDLEMYLEEETR